MGTCSILLRTSAGSPQLAATWTGTVPEFTTGGTWKLIWFAASRNTGPSTPPTTTQTPPRVVGTLPLTRSPGPTGRSVPAAAKPSPKTVAMAFGASARTAGVLKPALTTPPAVMCGATVLEAGRAVRWNVATGRPETVAVTATSPAVEPNVTRVDAVPLAPVTAEAALNVAVPELTANCTVTPPAGTPEASVTATVRASGSCWPTGPLC